MPIYYIDSSAVSKNVNDYTCGIYYTTSSYTVAKMSNKPDDGMTSGEVVIFSLVFGGMGLQIGVQTQGGSAIVKRRAKTYDTGFYTWVNFA